MNEDYAELTEMCHKLHRIAVREADAGRRDNLDRLLEAANLIARSQQTIPTQKETR